MARYFGFNAWDRLIGGSVSLPYCGSLITAGRRHPIITSIRYAGADYDYDSFGMLSVLLEPDMLFIDVGANAGAYAMRASKLIGAKGIVLAIEPVPSELRGLRMNTATDGNVRVLPVAVGRFDGQLNLGGSGETTHFLTEKTTVDAQVVSVRSLDDIVLDQGVLPRRAVLKIDVEGWEPAVVAGAERWLRDGDGMGIILEANGLQHRCTQATWQEAVEMLKASRYEFYTYDHKDLALCSVSRPGPVSPRGDYMVLREEGVERLVCAGAHLR
jgi:FkbM family methyltransferase